MDHLRLIQGAGNEAIVCLCRGRILKSHAELFFYNRHDIAARRARSCICLTYRDGWSTCLFTPPQTLLQERPVPGASTASSEKRAENLKRAAALQVPITLSANTLSGCVFVCIECVFLPRNYVACSITLTNRTCVRTQRLLKEVSACT